jgi:YgiT-type zinc finger domain-containing protein
MVKTAIWQGERLSVVEDVPALVCASCSEQYYDDDVTDALRTLNEEGFPESSADKTIQVSVFSLEARIRKRRALPEDTYVD